MRVLMLGGTEFVGRAVTVAALARGHEVTVFHRGSTNHLRGRCRCTATAPRPGTRRARGRRVGRGRRHLVARPASVRDTARLLAGRPGGTSTCRACRCIRDPAPAGAGEDAPLVDGCPTRRARWPIRRPSAAENWPRSRIRRGPGPVGARGLILGPWENIGRLPWWLNRAARGGDMLAPGPRDLGIQYIDCRDLAEWILDAAQARAQRPIQPRQPAGARHDGHAARSLRAGHRRPGRAALDRPRGRSSRPASSRGSSCRCGFRPASCTTRSTARRWRRRSGPDCAVGPSRRRSPTPGPGSARSAGPRLSARTAPGSVSTRRRRRRCWPNDGTTTPSALAPW